jgi:hypothetical protein
MRGCDRYDDLVVFSYNSPLYPVQKMALKLVRPLHASDLALELGLLRKCAKLEVVIKAACESVFTDDNGCAMLLENAGKQLQRKFNKVEELLPVFHVLRELHIGGAIHGDPRLKNLIKVSRDLLWIDLRTARTDDQAVLRQMDAINLVKSCLGLAPDAAESDIPPPLLQEAKVYARAHAIEGSIDKLAQLVWGRIQPGMFLYSRFFATIREFNLSSTSRFAPSQLSSSTRRRLWVWGRRQKKKRRTPHRDSLLKLDWQSGRLAPPSTFSGWHERTAERPFLARGEGAFARRLHLLWYLVVLAGS